ncbi:MAG: type II secretion system F family protein [Dehalococcoidia bacterium]|jgi:tight adherence protein B
MNVLALAAALSVLITVVMLFILFYVSTVNTGDKRVRARLQSIISHAPVGGPSSEHALKKNAEVSGLPILGSLLSGKEWTESVAGDLERANLGLRVGEYLTLRITVALLLFAVVMYASGRGTVGMLAGIAAGVVGFFLPRMYVKRRISSRLFKFDEQLVEALTLVANCLRSGFGFLQSMDLAAEQLKDPLSVEFKRTINDINVGASFEDALVALNDRIGSNDLDIVITAILIQRTVGGNLAEILDTVAHTMRERSRIKGELRTLTSQQKMSGYVVGGLPIVIIGILLILGKMMGDTYIATLFTTNSGRLALVAASIMEGMGILIIRRILNIEV